MADYSKKIVYLSYLEFGSRVKGAGFIKVESQGNKWSYDMHISGMTGVAEKKYDMYIINGAGEEHRIGGIFLHNGAGDYKENVEDKDSGIKGIACEEITRFVVKITDNKVIEGQYQDAGAVKKKEKEISGLADAGQPGQVKSFPFSKMEKASRPAEPRQLKIPGFMEEKPLKIAEAMVPPGRRGERRKSGGQEKEIRMEEMILNDKWEQLCQMYPVIHPYEDERAYISIQPKDFVVMTGDYQHLANNSFLLHGFYNYRHIILGRESDNGQGGIGQEGTYGEGKGKKREGTDGKATATGDFYLGVPGVYYEREKMVALMFGFEAFECRGGRAEAGQFGYYLRKVNI